MVIDQNTLQSIMTTGDIGIGMMIFAMMGIICTLALVALKYREAQEQQAARMRHVQDMLSLDIKRLIEQSRNQAVPQQIIRKELPPPPPPPHDPAGWQMEEKIESKPFQIATWVKWWMIGLTVLIITIIGSGQFLVVDKDGFTHSVQTAVQATLMADGSCFSYERANEVRFTATPCPQFKVP